VRALLPPAWTAVALTGPLCLPKDSAGRRRFHFLNVPAPSPTAKAQGKRKGARSSASGRHRLAGMSILRSRTRVGVHGHVAEGPSGSLPGAPKPKVIIPLPGNGRVPESLPHCEGMLWEWAPPGKESAWTAPSSAAPRPALVGGDTPGSWDASTWLRGRGRPEARGARVEAGSGLGRPVHQHYGSHAVGPLTPTASYAADSHGETGGWPSVDRL
jgi:hypothetical protein